jgi:hypothetical protein
MTGPLILIVLGVLFLLNNLYPGLYRFGKMWPVILIVIGIAKVIEYLQAQGQAANGVHVSLTKPDGSEKTEERKETQ